MLLPLALHAPLLRFFPQCKRSPHRHPIVQALTSSFCTVAMTKPDRLLSAKGFPSGFHAREELRLFEINNASYLAMPFPDSPVLDFPADRIAPITIIQSHNKSIEDQSWLQGLISDWLRVDDVFSADFLENVIFVTNKNQTANIDAIQDTMYQSWGTTWSTHIPLETGEEGVDSGPFVMWKGELCKALRLYDDPQQAFVMATKPQTQPGPFENLRVGGNYYSSLSIAVPSRITSVDVSDNPLAGARFAVKDLFNIQGLRLTVGCRAWYDLSQPAPKTALCLQQLLDQKANLVGTLKLGSLITREEPTESADYFAPFNPRGDGYQSAWSSSGGTGSAMASYEWLDFALATDTTGSSRRPALANGLFQLRVSQAALPFDGIVPSWAPFDSPAMYARDLYKLEKWIGAWISAKPEAYQLPISIIYPTDFLPVSNKAQMELIDGFVSDLESTLGVSKTNLSIKKLWKEKTPQEADSADISEFLKDVGVNSFVYGVYQELADFRDEYHKKYSKEPYVNPVMRWRWEAAKNVTREQHEDALNRLRIYKEWIFKEVLQVGQQNSLIVLPITSQAVDYRDVPPDPPSAPNAFDSIWLAPILSAPELSIPIGEIEYHSERSFRKERLPIVLSVLGEPGADMKLLDAARRTLEHSGRSTIVTTGSSMNVGDKYVKSLLHGNED